MDTEAFSISQHVFPLCSTFLCQKRNFYSTGLTVRRFDWMESWTAHSEGKTTCTGGKGTQGLNTQGRVRQLETGETHQGGEVVTHLRDLKGHVE